MTSLLHVNKRGTVCRLIVMSNTTYRNLQALDHLTSFVNDADRKTEMAKKRLLETQEELSSEVSQKVCLISLYHYRIT